MIKYTNRISTGVSRALCIIFLFFSFTQCRILRSVSDPAVRLYKRGSCISIDVPPITLTPSQTSLERQLIGDDAAIEENGWLIASAKSSTGTAMKDEDLTETRDLYREIGVIEYLSGDMQRYKNMGLIGESFDGSLKIIPKQHMEKSGIFIEPDEIRNAGYIIGEINKSREKILQYHIKRDSTKDGRDIDAINKKYKYIYFNQTKPGEWKQLKDGAWEKAR